jgi:hypothetical protein
VGLEAVEPPAGHPSRPVLDALLAAVPAEVPSGARCSSPHVLAVPSAVRRPGGRRPGKTHLVVRADVGSRHVTAPLTLRCTPAAGLN